MVKACNFMPCPTLKANANNILLISLDPTRLLYTRPRDIHSVHYKVLRNVCGVVYLIWYFAHAHSPKRGMTTTQNRPAYLVSDPRSGGKEKKDFCVKLPALPAGGLGG